MKIVVILSVTQLVTTVIFFSVSDKSRVKWDNSRNSTQKMRTLVIFCLQICMQKESSSFFLGKRMNIIVVEIIKVFGQKQQSSSGM